MARAREDLAKAETALAEKQATLKAEEERRESALSGEGTDSYREAIRLLAESDAQDSIRQLYADAGRTSTPVDDRLVGRIEEGDKRLVASQQEVQSIRASRRWSSPSAAAMSRRCAPASARGI